MTRAIILLIISMIALQKAHGQVGAADKQFIPAYKNITNPGFENGLTKGWTKTNTSGSVADSLNTSIKMPGGKQSRQGIMSSWVGKICNTFSVSSTDPLQNIVTLNVATSSVSGAKVCAEADGVEQLCADVVDSANFIEYSVPVTRGTTSIGVCYRQATASSGTFRIDDASAGPLPATATPELNNITPWEVYTPTFTGFGTVSTQTSRWRRNGSNLELDITFVAGTPTATEARVSFPSGVTAASWLPTLSFAGSGGRSVADNAPVVLKEPNVTYVTFSTSGSAIASLSKQNGSAILGAGQTFSFRATVPVNEWVASKVYSDRCNDLLKCETDFNASLTSVAGITSQDVTFIASGTNNTTGDNTWTFVSNAFSVTPSCGCFVVASSGAIDWSCIIESVSTTSVRTKTFRNGAGFAADLKLNCSRQGTDYTAAKINYVVGSFQGYVRAPGVNKPQRYTVHVGGASSTLASPTNCTTGTCVEVSDPASVHTSTTFVSTGAYEVTFANGTCANSTPVRFSVVGNNAGGGADPLSCTSYPGTDTWSSNASGGFVTRFLCSSITGSQTPTNAYFVLNLECGVP